MLWKWLKTKVFKPIGDFLGGIYTSIHDFILRKRNQKHPEQTSGNKIESTLSQTIVLKSAAPSPTNALQNQPTITRSPNTTNDPFLNFFSNYLSDTNLPNQFFTHDMQRVVPNKQFTTMMVTLSKASRFWRNIFKDELTKKAYLAFSQAVIDEDYPMLEKLLKPRPYLLTMDPPQGLKIESQLTWQRFIAEKPAIMAAKRKQLEMLQFLLPYYDKIADKNPAHTAKQEALTAWSLYEIKKNAQNEEEIVIPKEYTDYAESLIKVFTKETFPNGIDHYGHGELSEQTESALTQLFNKLLPKQAVKADYIDIELFLLAFYKAYVAHFRSFNNWNQRDAFCIRVIGLIQSTLTPRTAKIFCESLDKIVEALKKNPNIQKIEFSKLADSYRLKGGESFYRSRRETVSPLCQRQ